MRGGGGMRKKKLHCTHNLLIIMFKKYIRMQKSLLSNKGMYIINKRVRKTFHGSDHLASRYTI